MYIFYKQIKIVKELANVYGTRRYKNCDEAWKPRQDLVLQS